MPKYDLIPVLILFLFPSTAAHAELLFHVSNTVDSVYRYEVLPGETPVLQTAFGDSLDRPAYLAFDPGGDLFVVNRGAGSGGEGSIARFTDADGAPTLVSRIEDSNAGDSFDFDLPHGIVFRGAEMFVVNSHRDRVERYLFDIAGNPVANGAITAGICCTNARGIMVDRVSGQLFVTEANLGSMQIGRYSVTGGGAALLETFSSAGSNDHGMAVAPWGELFVTEANSNSVARFVLSGGSPQANGQIFGNGLAGPVDVAFSSWGEMFVSNGSGSEISRWTFDSLGVAIENGTIPTPNPGAGITFATDASTDVMGASAPLPASGADLLVFPNPGSSETFTFMLDVERPGPATLTIYDIRGRRIARPLSRPLSSGTTRIEWDTRITGGRNAPAGVYFAVLRTPDRTISKRFVRLGN